MQTKFLVLIFSLFCSWNVMAATSSRTINMDDGGLGGGSGSASLPDNFRPAPGGNCRVSCGGGSQVKVDMQSRCMCLGSKCFNIDIGSRGAMMTTNGTGTLGEANGARFQTHRGPGTTTLNNDAISMGIHANSKYGKWIHKSIGCGAGGNNRAGGRTNTAGCIGVPCAYWPEVKAQMGKSLTVCNGNQFESTRGQTIYPNGSRRRLNVQPGMGDR